ncbi:hypothetical protein MesoLjLb_67510 [Mesorhizobium sp. L-8-3]|nr:hypothetical protein MesoLjLb_67510 [Mesorhizobium sp. L-8-3]
MAVASDPLIELWRAQVRHYRPLIERIITQSQRRVLAGDPVPASEKLVRWDIRLGPHPSALMP